MSTPSSRLFLLSALVVTMPWLGCARHQQAAPPAAPVAAKAPQPPAATPKPVLDQRALDRLKQMSATLAGARAYSFKSSSSVEVPAKTGQFLTFFAHADVAVQRPNRFRVDMSGDLADFSVFYDGREVRAFDPAKKLYASTKAPGTIDETLDFLVQKLDIHFHFSDFMVSNPYAVMTKGLTSALLVGPARVDGVACDHLAFMAPGINWELWVEQGSGALPRRMAVTYTDVRNFPRFLVDIRDWNLNPRFGPSEFALKPPTGATVIGFGQGVKAVRQREPGVSAGQ